MMRWDNGPIPKGESRSHLLGLNDLFATLCELAGVTVPEGQAADSISFAEFIQNKEKTDKLRKQVGVWTYKAGILQEESIIRKDKLKLIFSRVDGHMELYDTEADLSETNNLIDVESYRDDVKEMLFLMKQIGPCHDNKDSFFIKKEDGTLKETNCRWFRNAPKQRCNNHYEGQMECRLSCSFNSPKVCSIKPPKLKGSSEYESFHNENISTETTFAASNTNITTETTLATSNTNITTETTLTTSNTAKYTTTACIFSVIALVACVLIDIINRRMDPRYETVKTEEMVL
mmetsp:Transcript_7224/g.8964  ORF Transcript_7224/g.8964 Transcript_7224/m.8964 type:complete len:289 (-) Transcript_7224:170-1036(-)